jgi:hypothetical protein
MLTLIRYIFFAIFGYYILRMARVFIDPMFEPKAPGPKIKPEPTGNSSSSSNVSPNLGEYVEFEEIRK